MIKRQRNHDLVFLNRVKSEAGLDNLRIAETVMRCPVFGRYKISQNQMKNLAEVLTPLGPRRLLTQVAGKVFDRRDLSRWLEKELSDREYQFSDEVEDEAWLFCIDESYYFGIPIRKGRDLADRQEDRQEERAGSLPPSVAAAMAFAGQAKDSDVIVDPVCGSGTLLAEVHAYAPGARRFGVDIDPAAVSIARSNLKLNDGELILKRDSRSLAGAIELKDISATLILANLPFGVQFGDKKQNAALYRDILKQTLLLARTPQAKAEWRAVLLTSDLDSLGKALDGSEDFVKQELFKVKIRGELASAVLVRPRAAATAAK